MSGMSGISTRDLLALCLFILVSRVLPWCGLKIFISGKISAAPRHATTPTQLETTPFTSPLTAAAFSAAANILFQNASDNSLLK